MQVSCIKFWLLCWFCWFFMYIYFCVIFLRIYFKNWHFWHLEEFRQKIWVPIKFFDEILPNLGMPYRWFWLLYLNLILKRIFFKLSNGPQNGKQNNSEELKIVQKFKNYSVTSPSPSPKKPQLLITRFTRLLLALIPHHIKTCSAGWLSLFFLHAITTYLAWTKHYFLLSHKVTISIYEKNICFDKQHNRS